MLNGLPPDTAYSVFVPDVVIFPILPVPSSANHKFPSEPAVIPAGSLPAGSEYSVIVPDVVIFPILLVPRSVNHSALSFDGPAVIPYGSLPFGSAYSVIVPDVVIFPILPVLSVREPQVPVWSRRDPTQRRARRDAVCRRAARRRDLSYRRTANISEPQRAFFFWPSSDVVRPTKRARQFIRRYPTRRRHLADRIPLLRESATNSRQNPPQHQNTLPQQDIRSARPWLLVLWFP